MVATSRAMCGASTSPATAVASWSVAKFAELKDAGGNTQPITTTPELALVGTERMVYVGTGLYLGPTDIPGAVSANASSSQTQSMYGLKDVLTTALPTPLRATLQQQTFTTTATTRTATNNPVDYATQNGWYIDFPTTGERVNTDPTIALGALIFTTNIPSGVVCQPGGSSWEYFINLKTGGLVDYSTVGYSGVFLGNALASRPVLIQLPSGKVVSLVRSSDAKTIEKDVPVAAARCRCPAYFLARVVQVTGSRHISRGVTPCKQDYSIWPPSP